MCDQIMSDARNMIDIKTTGVNTSSTNQNPKKSIGSRFTFKLASPNSSFNVGVDDVNIKFKWHGQTYHCNKFYDLCKGVAKRLFINLGPGGCLKHDSVVEGFTEYQDGDLSFRSHPLYCKEREWIDWALLKWNEISDPVPAKICMFLDLENSKMMTEREHQQFWSEFDVNLLGGQNKNNNENVREAHQFLTRSKWVVVQSCLSEEEQGPRPASRYRLPSRMGERYYLEDRWRLVPVKSIIDVAFCLPIGVDGMDVIHLKDQNEWKNPFSIQTFEK